MRISIMASLSGSGGRSAVDATVEHLAALHDEGFRRVWFSQLPNEPDLLTVLAVALREVDGIEAATGVLPIQNQHPMLLAQRALTLSLLSGGRFVLGLGLTHQVVTEGMWGIPWDKPVRRLREYLDGLLPLLAGEPADAVGETVTTRGALNIGAPAPDVYLAALGPQLLRLAGRRTAGTVTWMTGAQTLAEHVSPTLRAAAEEAGRPADAVRVVAALPVAVTDDVAALRATAAKQFAVYGQLPSYRAMLDREGYAGPEDAAIIGSEDEVAQRLAALRGVDEFVGAVFDPSPEGSARTRALLRRLDS
ncbi:TIGR03564 family F420-dependent LLM class oxidoreductase [Mycobacterium sp. M1]|uniref:TIGR03564 family F420-dependent LLM class oxidoreductase n=1 Tax=Mycolicibacter acidiphilus TaxID=2835306 RepID=A0ABS5RGB5_9MYCO|nr:TIGR03564 family F420-dependent LLM class oxidoreductase [Mycolicibacter acidiphilus]MBS9533325.1 TIGR03564 family F420-dependent LLM class oxidoreductase [Mycolicibacter acidiphilus]